MADEAPIDPMSWEAWGMTAPEPVRGVATSAAALQTAPAGDEYTPTTEAAATQEAPADGENTSTAEATPATTMANNTSIDPMSWEAWGMTAPASMPEVPASTVAIQEAPADGENTSTTEVTPATGTPVTHADGGSSANKPIVAKPTALKPIVMNAEPVAIAALSIPTAPVFTLADGHTSIIAYGSSGKAGGAGGSMISAPKKARAKEEVQDSRLTRQHTHEQEREAKPGKLPKLFGQQVGSDDALEPGDRLVTKSVIQGNETFCIESRDDTFKFDASINYPCRFYDNDGNPVGQFDSAHIGFRTHEHIGHINITLVLRHAKYRDLAKYTGVLRFSAEAVTVMQLWRTDNCEDNTAAEEEAHAGQASECFILCLQEYNPFQVCSEHVFTHDVPEGVAPLARYLRDGKPLYIHICGAEITLSAFKTMQLRFEQDRKACPLRAWIARGKHSFVIQKNEFILKGDRPDIAELPARNSFFSIDDFIITMTMATVDQDEAVRRKKQSISDKAWPMIPLKILGAGDRVFAAITVIPVEERADIKPGDSVMVLDPKTEDRNTALFAIVAEPNASLPNSVLLLHLYAKWDKEKGSFENEHWRHLNPVEVKDQAGLAANLSKLQDAKYVMIKLAVVQEEQTYKDHIHQLARVHAYLTHKMKGMSDDTVQMSADYATLILGNNLDEVSPYDIFKGILDRVPHPEAHMKGLNKGQLEAVKLARAAPAGVLNVHGPPGTGKTHLGTQLTRPFIIAGDFLWLCVAPTNAAVDSLVVGLHNAICECGAEGQYLVRAFSFDTEYDIVMRDIKLKRGKPKDAKPSAIQELDEDEEELLNSMSLAKSFYEAYKRQHDYDVDLVPDHRITQDNMRFSVGYRVLQLIGKIPVEKGSPIPRVSDFSELIELYRQFESGAELSSDNMKSFRELLKMAREQVLAGATVVCTTPGLSLQAKLSMPLGNIVRGIMVDESCRCSEIDVLCLIGAYPLAVAKVYLGDPCQLQPYLNRYLDAGPFAKQLGRAQHTRMNNNGTRYALLTEQHRMGPNLMKPVNNFGYDGKLTNHPSVLNRPEKELVMKFNRDNFNLAREVIYFDVEYAESQTAPGGSQYNVGLCQFATSIAVKIHDALPGLSLCILTGYNAQFYLYQSAKDKMVVKKQEYSSIMIDKIDRFQGKEVDLVILDATCAKRGGFLNQIQRWVVACSRARHGLWIVANKPALDSSNSRVISVVQSEYLQMHCRFRVNQGDLSTEFLDESMVKFEDIQFPEVIAEEEDDTMPEDVDFEAEPSSTNPLSTSNPDINDESDIIVEEIPVQAEQIGTIEPVIEIILVDTHDN